MGIIPSKVLVIDDERGVVQLCQRLLERHGYEVKTALTPQTGLDFLSEELFDLILLDIRMPGMDGFQVMQLARQKQPDLAVLMITGHGTIELAVQALRDGADGLALKPFTADELIQSVQQAISQNLMKREMSRTKSLQPLFEFSNQLFSELTPARLRRLVVESICKYLFCTAALLIRIPVNRAPSKNRLAAQIQKQIFFCDVPPDAEEKAQLSRCLAELTERSMQSQMIEQGSLQSPNGIRFLMTAPAQLHIPISTSNHQEGLEHLSATRHLEGNHEWLVLAAIRETGDTTSEIHSGGQNSFANADTDLLSILSHQAATAIENALLTSELRTHIRKLKESQRLLLQAEKMAAAGRLMASIAHEINNPLQAVQNCIHLAQRTELSQESRQDFLEMAQNELDRLSKTVTQMLDFHRPLNSDRRPVDLNSVLQRTIKLMSPKFEEHLIELSFDFDPTLPSVLSVADQIQQVFLNLVLNAVEAMPRGGKLRIITRTLAKNWVEISFQDSGTGIDPKIRKRIFDPFTSAKIGGTGLGLSISLGIITAHGGTLELVDNNNQDHTNLDLPGACFRIRLPAS
jgi:signal transduction histidine kinase/CheY-like chemotaxis protein